MTRQEKIEFILERSLAGHFFYFTYTKENGEVTRRQLRCNINIGAKMERQGTPINGRGAWMTGLCVGPRSMFIDKGEGIEQVRGTDMGDGKFKNFILDRMTDFA